MKKKLREYQKELLEQIFESININNKVCVQLSTGGGKTVIFTEMVQQLNAKTLILVDSIDLVNQTYETFKKQGVDIGMVLAGNKKFPENKVVVAMVTSLWNRVKKDTDLLKEIKYCVVDECHIWIFNKLFPYLENAKIIGFTATPVRLKRYKINEEQTAVETMSDVYDDIVVGKPINWLIENKYLVKDKNYLIDFDGSGLKTDASGEFTAESMKRVFQHPDYLTSLRNAYEVYCENKKTMIFSSSTETNAIFSEIFKDKNVMTYDSVNNKSEERDGIIEWFKKTPNAILINTGCFTKGFDVCDVECIIVARATKSLSLWIQICGRGARITNKIKKDNIIIIDGGNNIEEHGTFSFNRNWSKIFYDQKIKYILEPQQECESCGFTFDEKENICPNCFEKVPEKDTDFEIQKETKTYTIKGQRAKLEPPKIDVNDFINKGKTDYESLKILAEKWIHFIFKNKIEKENFEHHRRLGTFQKRFDVLLKPKYLIIIRSILKKGKNVIYKNYCEKILTKAYIKKYGNN